MNREDVKYWSSINDEYNDIHDHDDKEDLNECEKTLYGKGSNTQLTA